MSAPRGSSAALVVGIASLAVSTIQAVLLTRVLVGDPRVLHAGAVAPRRRRPVLGRRRTGRRGGLVRPVAPLPPQDPHAITGQARQGRTHIP